MRTGIVSILAGILVSMLLPELAGKPLVLSCLLFPLFYLVLPVLRLLALFSLGMLFGICFAWKTWVAVLPLPLEGKTLQLQGFVTGLPKQTERGAVFDFEVDAILSPDHAVGLPLKHLRLSWYGNTSPEPGSYWQMRVGLKTPRGFVNPSGFDYQHWLLEQGYQATGYVKHGFMQEALAPRLPASVALSRLRYQLISKLAPHFPDPAELAVVSALVVGEKNAFDSHTRQMFINTGTSHLMVVSGLHIGLMFLFGYLLGKVLFRLFMPSLLLMPLPFWCVVSGLLFALVYAFIAGFSLSTQRALVMGIAATVVMLSSRRLPLMLAFLLALLVVVLLSPLSLFSASLWFSFTASGVLLYVCSARLRPGGFFWTWLRPQWSVFVGMMPVVLVVTGQFVPFSLLANFVAVPFVSFILLPLTLLTALVVQAGFEPVVLSRLVSMLINALLFFLESCASLGGTGLQPVKSGLFEILMALLGVLLILSPRGTPFRYVGCLLMLPLVFPVWAQLPHGQLRMTVLDVGQGLGVFLQTRHHTLLYDTGPRFSDNFDAGSSIIAPYVLSQGHAAIDHLMVSHSDSDHAGGLEGFLSQVDADKRSSGTPERLGPVTGFRTCLSGDHWYRDGFQFEILSPFGDDKVAEGNDRSCVLKVSGGGHSLLIPGDIEKQQEYRLVQQHYEQLASTVLLAPHHGSQTSSTLPFIHAVSPEWVIYSTGYRNRYRHPSAVVQARYKDRGVKALNTAETGAIMFDFKKDGSMEIHNLRQHARRWWYF